MPHTPYLESLFRFIDQSPTAFHAVSNATATLDAHGFRRLLEAADWGRLAPGKYYVSRNDSSLIAFILQRDPASPLHLRMAGAHTDSPGLRLKPNPVQIRQGWLQLGAEVYGGALLAPWFDRDLSLAGRVTWQRENGPLRCSLIDFARPLAIIPSLAIHLDREANNNRKIDKQNDLVPLVMQGDTASLADFTTLLRDQLCQEHPEAGEATLLDWDLFFYDTQKLSRLGLQGELIAGSRLDNLLSCHALIQGLIHTKKPQDSMIILNDHEEVGSVSTAGAQGPFLKNTLERLFPEPNLRQQVLAGSLFISADNAHAVHPNFAAKHDPDHLPLLNKGPVIKLNAGQRYATSGPTASLFRLYCQKAGVPCQQFVMRNDMACGSTIGPLTAAETGVPTVDVGVPQLAMHSIRETAGHLDGWYLTQALATFFAEADAHIACPAIGLA